MTRKKFELGQVVATIGVLELVRRKRVDLQPLLVRHLEGDWGDLLDANKQQNERALVEGGSIVSAYYMDDGNRVFIYTNGDRTLTKAMLAEDF